MRSETCKTAPIAGQRPGTSGLRKKTKVFMSDRYLENFIQSMFDAIGGAAGTCLVLGGDGRFFNEAAAQVILKMASANGAAKVIIGQGAVLSTPAASHLIRLNKTDGGIIMSASHNPGGPDEDFGVKFNTPNGGPAPESVTEAIFACTTTISEYRILRSPDVDLGKIGLQHLGNMDVLVIDPVADYTALMEILFDFPVIRAMFARGFRMRFDAMCAGLQSTEGSERGHESNRAVAAHADGTDIVEEDDAQRARRVGRFADEGADEDIRAARFVDHGGAEMVVHFAEDLGSFRHRPDAEIGAAGDDDACRFAGRMRVDGVDFVHDVSRDFVGQVSNLPEPAER